MTDVVRNTIDVSACGCVSDGWPCGGPRMVIFTGPGASRSSAIGLRRSLPDCSLDRRLTRVDLGHEGQPKVNPVKLLLFHNLRCAGWTLTQNCAIPITSR